MNSDASVSTWTQLPEAFISVQINGPSLADKILSVRYDTCSEKSYLDKSSQTKACDKDSVSLLHQIDLVKYRFNSTIHSVSDLIEARLIILNGHDENTT
ncbi:uncharacterized protein V6R79_010174 [Siganus canaliculatus]